MAREIRLYQYHHLSNHRYPLLAYCTLPVVCLLAGKFIVPQISNITSIWFISLFLSIFATGILEINEMEWCWDRRMGLMGRQNRTPTIIVVWSVLLASIFSLIWVRVDPFTAKVTGPDVEQCGINC
ncbi:CELLULOSE SYNTHASE [Salix suchowensis]|nr:CELLULOSE SYNTHASE [Salix suchowensis]